MHKNNTILKLTEMVIDGAVVVSNICRVKAGISTNLMWKKVQLTNGLRMRNIEGFPRKRRRGDVALHLYY